MNIKLLTKTILLCFLFNFKFMKRKLLISSALFLVGLSAIGQNSFGLKAGINLAYQSITSTSAVFSHPTLQTKPLFGYQFGVFYKAKISKKLLFSTEANLSLIGSRDKYLTSPLPGDTAFIVQYVNNKVGYIEVPLMIQYNPSSFYISAGPALLLKIFSKSALSYNSFDLAGKLLVGYNMSKKWDINLSYSYGLININKDSNGESKRKNRYFNLSLLYTL